MTSTPAPPRSRSRRRRPLVVATVLLGLALTGCADSQPGVVAYVGDAQISESDVDTAVTGLSSTLQPGQTVAKEAVVNALIQGVLAEQIAGDRGITVTDADREKVLEGTNLESLLSVPAVRPIAYDVADSAIVSEKVGSEAYLAELAKRQVTLNPRYGVLDPKLKTIVTDQSGSLSVPAPGASAAATP